MPMLKHNLAMRHRSGGGGGGTVTFCSQFLPPSSSPCLPYNMCQLCKLVINTRPPNCVRVLQCHLDLDVAQSSGWWTTNMLTVSPKSESKCIGQAYCNVSSACLHIGFFLRSLLGIGQELCSTLCDFFAFPTNFEMSNLAVDQERPSANALNCICARLISSTHLHVFVYILLQTNLHSTVRQFLHCALATRLPH